VRATDHLHRDARSHLRRRPPVPARGADDDGRKVPLPEYPSTRQIIRTLPQIMIIRPLSQSMRTRNEPAGGKVGRSPRRACRVRVDDGAAAAEPLDELGLLHVQFDVRALMRGWPSPQRASQRASLPRGSKRPHAALGTHVLNGSVDAAAPSPLAIYSRRRAILRARRGAALLDRPAALECAGWLGAQTCTHARAHARTHARTHARVHAYTHGRTCARANGCRYAPIVSTSFTTFLCVRMPNSSVQRLEPAPHLRLLH
jgi:hypothetical protein